MERQRLLVREGGLNLAPEIMHIDVRGVDDDVSIGSDITEQLTLALESIQNALLALERMRPARGFEPTYK